MRTMVRISNRDNSPIPSRMLEHRGADRAGLAIAVWHRNCPDSRDRGPRPRPNQRGKARAAPGRSGPCVTIRMPTLDTIVVSQVGTAHVGHGSFSLWGVVGCGLRGAIDHRQGRLGGAAGRRHFFCHVGFRVAKGFPGYRPVSVLRRSRC